MEQACIGAALQQRAERYSHVARQQSIVSKASALCSVSVIAQEQCCTVWFKACTLYLCWHVFQKEVLPSEHVQANQRVFHISAPQRSNNLPQSHHADCCTALNCMGPAQAPSVHQRQTSFRHCECRNKRSLWCSAKASRHDFTPGSSWCASSFDSLTVQMDGKGARF